MGPMKKTAGINPVWNYSEDITIHNGRSLAQSAFTKTRDRSCIWRLFYNWMFQYETSGRMPRFMKKHFSASYCQ